MKPQDSTDIKKSLTQSNLLNNSPSPKNNKVLLFINSNGKINTPINLKLVLSSILTPAKTKTIGCRINYFINLLAKNNTRLSYFIKEFPDEIIDLLIFNLSEKKLVEFDSVSQKHYLTNKGLKSAYSFLNNICELFSLYLSTYRGIK